MLEVKGKYNVKFFMPMIPPTVTHQEKKVVVRYGKPLFYEAEDLKDARQKLKSALIEHIPQTPFNGPLRCITKWLFPIKGKRTHGQWKTTTPDTHNMNKLLFDVMTYLNFWNDDAQVASEIIEKFWSETPGIYIEIEELTNAD